MIFPTKRAREAAPDTDKEDKTTILPLDVTEDAIRRNKHQRTRSAHEHLQYYGRPSPTVEVVIPMKKIQSLPADSPVRGNLSTAVDISYDTNLVASDRSGARMPRLVFRWSNSNSQGFNSPQEIRAGRFRDERIDISPPLTGSRLRGALLNHLTPEQEPSPFISTFESPMPAIHRALKVEEQTNSRVAIIDLQRATSVLEARFPDSEEVAYLVPTIIKRYGFKLRNQYRASEWLLHGIIDQSAIVATIHVSDIWRIAKSHRTLGTVDLLEFIKAQTHASGLGDLVEPFAPKMSWLAGLTVGNFLVDVPDSHKALVARKIANVFHFHGYKTEITSFAMQEYLCGVYDLPEGANFPFTSSNAHNHRNAKYSKEGGFVTSSNEEDCYNSGDSYSFDLSDDDGDDLPKTPAATSEVAVWAVDEERDQALIDAQLKSSLDASTSKKQRKLCVEITSVNPAATIKSKPKLSVQNIKTKHSTKRGVAIVTKRPSPITPTKIASNMHTKASVRKSKTTIKHGVAISTRRPSPITPTKAPTGHTTSLFVTPTKPKAKNKETVIIDLTIDSEDELSMADDENDDDDDIIVVSHGKRRKWIQLASTREYSVLVFRSASAPTGLGEKKVAREEAGGDVTEVMRD